jgi:hypothetical protein
VGQQTPAPTGVAHEGGGSRGRAKVEGKECSRLAAHRNYANRLA